MYELAYVTRGNSDPRGKEHVYFACHPDDLNRYLPEIAADIHATHNCAIYYDSDPRAERSIEEMYPALYEMKLFVIPVTEAFLYTENRARCVEYAYATSHDIPVLPLLQQPGLEKIFNELCGNRQFLDKYTHDATAIPYAEKLEKFLRATLLGDELLAKVRAAFDAYIFLSYRKKDRAYAQELMRLIHRNDFCRDIAIWYDEYLEPGMNFEESIRVALEKSCLFTLVVTPRLLEKNDLGEDNYIKAVEYPLATKSEHPTPVLPAEMEDTNRTDMTIDYEGIPPIINGRDQFELSDALMAHLTGMVIREDDDDREHNFFIGLAYLGGIDVEVDHERARLLITMAAQADPPLPEALEKLVYMYRYGEGVGRDYEQAIEWQKKLVTCREECCRRDPNETTFQNLYTAMMDLQEYHAELRQWFEAKCVAEQMLSRGSLWEKHTGNRQYQVIAYEKLGDIARADGRSSEAQTYYMRGGEIQETLARERKTVQAYCNLAIIYEKIGELARLQGEENEARRFAQGALDIYEMLSIEDGYLPEIRRGLAHNHDLRGNIEQFFGNNSKARQHFEQEYAIIRQLAEEMGTVSARRDLSVSCARLGIVCEALGDMTSAEVYYLEGLKIDEALVQETETREACRNLSVSYNYLGDLAQIRGYLAQIRGDLAQMGEQYMQAWEYYEKALDIAIDLRDKADTTESKRDVMIGYDKLGNIAQRLDDQPGAQMYYYAELSLCQELADQLDTMEAWDELAVCQLNLAAVTGQHEHAQEALNIWTRLAETYSAVPEHARRREMARDRLERLNHPYLVYLAKSFLRKIKKIFNKF